jgi:FkbM family methyltransferase
MNIQSTDYEGRLNLFYESLLSIGDTAIDIGAHSGRHTIPMAMKVGSTGKVIAFEPQPLIREKLKENIAAARLQNTVCIECCALGNYEGNVDFTIAVDLPEESGFRKRHVYNGSTSIEIITVDVRKLDSYSFDQLKFIKIDTEGAELDVVLGSVRIVEAHRPVIAFEFGAASFLSYHDKPELMYQFFDQRYYSIYDILGKKLNADSFVKSSIDQNIWDYIAIPNERSALESVKIVKI